MRVFSPLQVSSASISARARVCGGSLPLFVPMVIVTMPFDARNGPHWRMLDCGET